MSNSFAAPWTVAPQTLQSMGFPRQEYWSGLPFPSPGDLPNPRIEPSPPALAGRFFTHWSTRETQTDEDTRAQFQTHWVWRGHWLPKQRWRLKPQICLYPPTQPPIHLPMFGEQLLTFQWLSSFTELSAGEDKRWRWKERPRQLPPRQSGPS